MTQIKQVCCDKWKYLWIVNHQYDEFKTLAIELQRISGVVKPDSWKNVILFCPQCGKKLELLFQEAK